MATFFSPHINFVRLGGFVLALFALFAPNQLRAASLPSPNAAEQLQLDRYPSYTKNIHVLEKNTSNNIHSFLEANLNKVVFLDTGILRYAPMNPNLTQAQKDRAPTDRFQNAVHTKCPMEDVVGSYTDFGAAGYPLPVDDRDINAGCKKRLRLELTDGDVSPNISILKGNNKVEIILSDFFKISKRDLDGGKALYVLTQQEIAEETFSAFAKFKRKVDREDRKLSLD